jgi:hypothetical protein
VVIEAVGDDRGVVEAVRDDRGVVEAVAMTRCFVGAVEMTEVSLRRRVVIRSLPLVAYLDRM